MRFKILLIVVCLSVLSCDVDNSNSKLLVLDDDYVNRVDSYEVRIQAIKLQADIFLPDSYDFGRIYENRVFLASIDERLVDIFDLISGKLLKRLKAESPTDPFSFKRPYRLSIDEINYKTEPILRITDGMTYRTYEYSLEGEFESFYDSGCYYNDSFVINDSTTLLSVYGINNAHVSTQEHFLGGADFLITVGGKPFKVIGQNSIRIEDSGRVFRHRNFFKWGKNIGYFNPFLDEIILLNGEFEISRFKLDFSHIGEFANLYKDTIVLNRLEYSFERNLIMIEDVSYKDDQTLLIRYNRNGRSLYYFHDLVNNECILHTPEISTSEFPDINITTPLLLDDNVFGGTVSYYQFHDFLLNAKSRDVDIYTQAIDFTSSIGLDPIEDILDSGDSLYLHNPILFITTIAKKEGPSVSS